MTLLNLKTRAADFDAAVLERRAVREKRESAEWGAEARADIRAFVNKMPVSSADFDMVVEGIEDLLHDHCNASDADAFMAGLKGEDA